MADIDFINKNFKQDGEICALASYATVIEYFSNKEIIIDNVLEKYIALFNIPIFAYSKNKKKKQNKIFEHFHTYCYPNIRGFEFIEKLHRDNDLNTNQVCKIIASKAELKSINQADIDLIQNELIQNDALAIVLYKVSEKKFHAITIGYDSGQHKFIVKDPNKKILEVGDVFSNRDVWEYIIFNDY